MTKPTSVWIVKQYAVPPDLAGNTRHYELGRRLVQRGYDVTIFATSYHYSQHRDVRLASDENWNVEEVDGVKFVWIRSFPFETNDWRRVLHMLSFMVRTYRVGRRLPDREPRIAPPDVVVGCSVPPFAALAGYGLARAHPSRFVFEVGDLWPETLIDMGALSRRNPITHVLEKLESFLYRRAERILTPLPNASAHIERYGIAPEKIVWLPNGVDTQAFRPLVDGYSADGADFTVIYAGVHGYAQSLETLVEAAGVLTAQGEDGVRIVLIGNGAEKTKLQKLAQSKGLGNVEFRDSIPKGEMPDVLNRADVAVFPLRDTPLFRKFGVGSKKLFDYLAAGIPIIYAVASANDPVGEADCGFPIEPDNPEAMASAIRQLYRMTEAERREMGQRGRAYAERHHDWSVLADRLQAVLAPGEFTAPINGQ